MPTAFVAGLVGAVILSAAFWSFLQTDESVTRFQIPGELEVELSPGRYMLFIEVPSAQKDFYRESSSQYWHPWILVKDGAGNVLYPERHKGQLTYDFAGRKGWEAYDFKVTTRGTHLLLAKAPEVMTLVLDDSLVFRAMVRAGGRLATLFAALAVVIGSAVGAIMRFRASGRARRARAAARPPAP